MPSFQEEDYKTQYKDLKRKFKTVIYENECYKEELSKAQKILLKLERDKAFLLDRMLQYHKGHDTSSDSEQTEESDNETDSRDVKRRRTNIDGNVASNCSASSSSKNLKRKRNSNINGSSNSKLNQKSKSAALSHDTNTSEGQLSREEIEKHLAARQPVNNFPTTVSLTVPNQLFSDNIFDGELHEEDVETSPSNIEDEITVDSFD